MALTSPGVQVSVIDESFYVNAEPGTRPLVVVATAANKINASGTGTAQGTLTSNAGRVYTVTSQRELAELFGDPTFKIDSNGNPIHAGEINEYGLQAAYSFLGVSNSALVVRANVDLNELTPSATVPGGKPEDGTFWLDTANSLWGIFEWNAASAVAGGQVFTNKVPTVYLDGVPAASEGTAGDYAVVADPSNTPNEYEIKYYYKSAYTEDGATGGNEDWVLVGSDEWATAHAVTKSATNVNNTFTIAGNLVINNIAINLSSADNLAEVVTAINGSSGGANVYGARAVGNRLEIFARDAQLASLIIGQSGVGADALSVLNLTSGTYPTPKVKISKHTDVPQFKTGGSDVRPTGSVWVKTTEPNAGARWRVKQYNTNTGLWVQKTAGLYASDAAAVTALDPAGGGVNIVNDSVYVQYDFNATPGAVQVAEFRVKRWQDDAWIIMPAQATASQYYFISESAPETLAADGKLWYSSVVDEVDFMVHNGTTWVGLNNYGPYADAQVIVSASQPELNGTQKGQDNHLWIDTSDLENYPNLKRWNEPFQKWELVDSSDQTTEFGILFADARWAADGETPEVASISSLLTSNYVDPDAPDPALYPQGMLLWNTRRSGFNVKRFVRNYIDVTTDNIRFNNENMNDYYPHRWVTESGNRSDGSGNFGRHAQRKVVVQALQAVVKSNEEIRDTERNSFNLLACPGYPELIGELVELNSDRGITAFVVGDSPARLANDATSLNNWGTNVRGAEQDSDEGLVSRDEYLGVFYPWGFTSDNFGRNVVVPPSHMILRMIAINDQVAYPWFAPAGTRRGGITNATAVGYVNAEGEFQSVALNDGQRDTLYNVAVNPITFFVGAGLVNFGQKTRARASSALDRINVARLVIYLRNQLSRLAKPYIFEPNDKITRDEIKQQVESLLLELVGQRALYDFLVVCDESNNTPNRIDRNELYVDIAIEPVKAVEFIYIPVRLKNTGEIAALG